MPKGNESVTFCELVVVSCVSLLKLMKQNYIDQLTSPDFQCSYIKALCICHSILDNNYR